jgi:hypothetical protein
LADLAWAVSDLGSAGGNSVDRGGEDG